MAKVKKKKYYDDPIKEDYREKAVLGVALEHEKEMRKTKDWKVATLMGEWLQEYYQVWGPLGIRPENITVVENNLKIIDHLRKKMKKANISGFNIEHADALDFFRDYDRRFHYVHLDTESQFNPKLYQLVAYIAGKQRLDEKAILGINVVANRESKEIQNFYRVAAIISRACKNWSDNTPSTINPSESDLKPLRDRAISSVQYVLRMGKDNTKLNDVFARDPNRRAIEENIEFSREKALKKLMENNGFDTETAGTSAYFLEGTNLRNTIMDFDYFDSLGVYLNSVINGYAIMTDLIRGVGAHPYIVKDVHAFQYTGEGRTTMLSNFYFLDQLRDIYDRYKELSDSVFVGPLKLSGEWFEEQMLSGTSKGKIKKNAKNFEESSKRDLIRIREIAEGGFQPTERIDLGSSAGRPDIGSKAEYRKLLIRELKEKGGEFDPEVFKQKLRKDFKNDRDSLDGFQRWYTVQGHAKARITKRIAEDLVKHGWDDERIDRYFRYDGHSQWVVRGYRARQTREFNNQKRESVDKTIADVPKVYPITAVINSGNPHKFLDRMSKDAIERIQYFVREDVPYRTGLNNGKTEELFSVIRETKWYRDVRNRYESANGNVLKIDKAVRNFFDDVMLETMKNGVPSREKIERIYSNAVKECGL